MALLELSDVTAGYGATPVLRDVDLAAEAGEIVGVVGKNGVGKTTLLKTVIGLLEPESGSVEYRGEDVTDAPADARARAGIGYIPQGRGVFPDLTVEQNLRMGEHVNAGSPRPSTTRSTTSSPSSRSGPRRTAGPCPAASSRCSPSPAR